jgi:type IV secretion system protein VirD4
MEQFNSGLNREERIRLVKVVFSLMSIFFLIGMCVATQRIAADCNYNELLGRSFAVGSYHIYPPFMYFVWDDKFTKVMPAIMHSAELWLYGISGIGFLFSVIYIKNSRRLTTHGSAKWASEKDIIKADLTRNPGVIIGVNPYTNELLRDDGPTHIFLMAPTRGGKGIGAIIPTLLTWIHSVFVTDVKGENWEKTSGYRKKVMHQKCIKFAPLENDGSSARWNSLAEIRLGTAYESSDVEMIAGILINPYGANKSGDYWPQAGKVLLKGAILHHMYWYQKENRPLPSLTHVLTFLSNISEALPTMATYPHITSKEFMKDCNIFQECYGDSYITDFSLYNKEFKKLFQVDCNICSIEALKDEIRKHPVKGRKNERQEVAIKEAIAAAKKADTEAEEAEMQQQVEAEAVTAYEAALEEAKAEAEAADPAEKDAANANVIELFNSLHVGEQESDKLARKAAALAAKAEEAHTDMETLQAKYKQSEAMIDFTKEPWCYLLVHPKVRECALSMLDKQPAEMSGVQSTSVTALSLYQDPIIQKNTSVSDFRVEDLLDPKQAVAFYLIIPPNDLYTLTPLVRLLINIMFNRLIRDMKDEHVSGCKRQRLLLMLDEFAQFGRFETVQQAMSVCASYGIKMCIVAQNINQINDAYGRNQSIIANCHTQVNFTPNLDGGETARALSAQLGKTTISTKNRSDGGGGIGKGSISTSNMARDLMSPDEITKMPFEDEIIMVARSNPIYAKKLMYFNDERFVKRSWTPEKPYFPPPIYSDVCEVVDSFDKLRALQLPELEAKKKAQDKVQAARDKAFEEECKKWSVENPSKTAMDALARKDTENETKTNGVSGQKSNYAIPQYDPELGWQNEYNKKTESDEAAS